MDPEKQARLEAAGFHVTNDPRDLLEPLEVITELRARVAELEAQYGELIFAVATKYPDETRHQTALRYIQQAENREASPACELKP